ncbi:unnamed protein product [Rotaria magnacalcarata]
MTSNKRIKRIKAIDSFDFELFVRAHLSTDLADTLILKLGIRTYNGFIECEHFQEELLAVYNSMNEKDKQNLFLYDTSSSLSTPTQVKPGILREFNIFRQECKIYKPTMNDDNNLTDWSFNQEDVFDYNTISNDNKIFDQFMIQEKRMAIKSQDIHKFIFQLQSTLEWHLEQFFKKSILENGEDLINKVHWLVNYIKESNYKPSGYSHSLD